MAKGSTGKWSDQYKDPRWQKKRLEIMKRDDFACRSCGDKESTLNVHHAYYEKGKKPWEYPDSILITWCEKCHKLNHESMKGLQAELLELSCDDLEYFHALVGCCGAKAALQSLADSLQDDWSVLPSYVKHSIHVAIKKHPEAFMVLFHSMNPEPVLKALIDANADYGFADPEAISNAITLLARCYQQGSEDGTEQERHRSQNEG